MRRTSRRTGSPPGSPSRTPGTSARIRSVGAREGPGERPSRTSATHEIIALPTYVVSKSVTSGEWETPPAAGHVHEEVRELKERPGGDILLSGSADLVDALLDRDPIDEYRIEVYPVVLGGGKRLFRRRDETVLMRLRETRMFASGIVLRSFGAGHTTRSLR